MAPLACLFKGRMALAEVRYKFWGLWDESLLLPLFHYLFTSQALMAHFVFGE